jgi:membrane-associated phospholipid phosphatase
MNTLTAATAQYLLFLILLTAAVIWLFLPRQDKVSLAGKAIVSLVVMVVLIKLAAVIHTDPRPFVVDPSIKPLFAHPGDNGFPSDHTALGVTVALLVMIYRRWLGALLLAAAIVVGATRMAAHVHHGQDIVAGILIAVLAVGIASAAWRWVGPRMPRRLTEPGSAAQTASAPDHGVKAPGQVEDGQVGADTAGGDEGG